MRSVVAWSETPVSLMRLCACAAIYCVPAVLMHVGLALACAAGEGWGQEHMLRPVLHARQVQSRE